MTSIFEVGIVDSMNGNSACLMDSVESRDRLGPGQWPGFVKKYLDGELKIEVCVSVEGASRDLHFVMMGIPWADRDAHVECNAVLKSDSGYRYIGPANGMVFSPGSFIQVGKIWVPAGVALPCWIGLKFGESGKEVQAEFVEGLSVDLSFEGATISSRGKIEIARSVFTKGRSPNPSYCLIEGMPHVEDYLRREAISTLRKASIETDLVDLLACARVCLFDYGMTAVFETPHHTVKLVDAVLCPV